MPVIPALGRLRQEDREFEYSLGYIARSHLKTIQIYLMPEASQHKTF
jgi:hypothetical protein